MWSAVSKASLLFVPTSSRSCSTWLVIFWPNWSENLLYASSPMTFYCQTTSPSAPVKTRPSANKNSSDREKSVVPHSRKKRNSPEALRERKKSIEIRNTGSFKRPSWALFILHARQYIGIAHPLSLGVVAPAGSSLSSEAPRRWRRRRRTLLYIQSGCNLICPERCVRYLGWTINVNEKSLLAYRIRAVSDFLRVFPNGRKFQIESF